MKKPKRNAPCPCGSGYKYKDCCLLEEEVDRVKQEVADLPEVRQFMRMIEEGYALAEKGHNAKAGDAWLEAWEYLKTWLADDIRDATSLNIMASDPIVPSDWLHTVRITLGDAARTDRAYGRKKLAFCRDVCSRLPDTNPIDLAEFKQR
jgi:hypothetical protein